MRSKDRFSPVKSPWRRRASPRHRRRAPRLTAGAATSNLAGTSSRGIAFFRRFRLHRRAGPDLVRDIARDELAVFEIAQKIPPFDDDLAAQHRKRWPGG